MKPLSKPELELVFQKVIKYIGSANMTKLLERQDGEYVFRFHRQKVYYMNSLVLKRAGCIAAKKLLSCGTCIGKFTHSNKFHLLVTALELLAPLARFKVAVKKRGEMNYLYGNHIVKAHLKRVPLDMTANAGVVVFSEQEVPLGFGVSAKSTNDCTGAQPEALVVYHQADVGEYLRDESELF